MLVTSSFVIITFVVFCYDAKFCLYLQPCNTWFTVCLQCRAKLTELLTFIKAAVIEPQTGIVLPVESWQTDKLILSESDLQNLTAQVNALL